MNHSINPLNWLKELLDLIERPRNERLQHILHRNAEWCRQAQLAPPLSDLIDHSAR